MGSEVSGTDAAVAHLRLCKMIATKMNWPESIMIRVCLMCNVAGLNLPKIRQGGC